MLFVEPGGKVQSQVERCLPTCLANAPSDIIIGLIGRVHVLRYRLRAQHQLTRTTLDRRSDGLEGLDQHALHQSCRAIILPEGRNRARNHQRSSPSRQRVDSRLLQLRLPVAE